MPRQQLVRAMEQYGDMEHLTGYEVDIADLPISIGWVPLPSRFMDRYRFRRDRKKRAMSRA
jgi:hypothetical protein